MTGKLQAGIGTFRKIVANNLINRGVFSRQTDKRFTILMYHGIDKNQDTTFNQRFFSQTNFEKQVIAFKKHLHILSGPDFINNNFSPEKLNVLLTFDDGYANNFNYALPILDKYNAHAFFFITGVGNLNNKVLWADALDIVSRYAKEDSKVTVSNIDFYFKNGSFINEEKKIALKTFIKESKKSGYAEKEELIGQLLSIYDFTKKKELNDHWQLMTDDQICKTSLSKNITIGSHGFYHNNLGALSNEDAVNEVELSRTYLENITQKKISTIGYPDGSYTEQLNDALYKTGFTKQFLVNYNFDDAGKRDFTYDRVGLYPFMGNNNEIFYKILNQ